MLGRLRTSSVSNATASIWLADTTPQERNSSAAQFWVFKLKSIQEMAAIRFDNRPLRGREVRSARLFLHKAAAGMLRYLRVSTVNQDWVDGRGQQPYGPADGATYAWADATHQRPWSYPGSEFADVVMGMGHSITTYAEQRQEPGDWISVELTPELVYALGTGSTDGLAVMDGGNPAYFNNFIHSAQARAHAPYIEVVTGDPLVAAPAAPQVTAEAAPSHAHLATGAIEDRRCNLTPTCFRGSWSSTASQCRDGRSLFHHWSPTRAGSRTTFGAGEHSAPARRSFSSTRSSLRARTRSP